MRLQVFGLAIFVATLGILESEKGFAQAPELELHITIVCVDINSATYEQLQIHLDSLAEARNCQRGGLSRHELTGVFETQEIRRMILSLVDAKQANVCWFDRAKIRCGRYVEVPNGPWVISRSGSDFVAMQGSLEIYRGNAERDLEAIGIRLGMSRRRSWPEGGGVPGLHSGPGSDFINVRPGETIVIADRDADWPDSIFLGADDEYKKKLCLQAESVPTRRLMLLEVPPRICPASRLVLPIASPGYAMRPKAAVE